MNKQSMLFDYVERFFQDYLKEQRSVSFNTILAYRDTLRLLFNFACQHLGKITVNLEIDDLTLDVVLAFLSHIETSRKNKTTTRNSRLAALKTFFTYLCSQDPIKTVQFQKIVFIPIKRPLKQPADYIQKEQLQALLQSIGRATPLDRRDYCLIYLLYNTGARVSEICDLRVENIRFESPAMISLLGKGRKIRQIPLWKETINLLKDYMIEHRIIQNPQAKIFSSQRGEPLNRFSVRRIIQRRVEAANQSCPHLALKNVTPHTFRHTTAMHLLQAGVDLTVIKSWLGHVNLSTTHDYIEIDLDMKRKALSACVPLEPPEALKKVTDRNRDVIRWLDSLSTHPLCDLDSG